MDPHRSVDRPAARRELHGPVEQHGERWHVRHRSPYLAANRVGESAHRRGGERHAEAPRPETLQPYECADVAWTGAIVVRRDAGSKREHVADATGPYPRRLARRRAAEPEVPDARAVR